MATVCNAKLVRCETLIHDSESKSLIADRCNGILNKVEQQSLLSVPEQRDDDSEYQLVVDCCKLLVDVEDEAFQIQNSIYHKYESLKNRHPDMVNKFINHRMEEFAVAEIQGLLPRETIRILEEAMDASDRVLFLDSAKKKLLDFVENHIIAPNLVAIVGTAVAARLIGSAGGLVELSKFASSDLPGLGPEIAPVCAWDIKTAPNFLCSGYTFEPYQFGYLEESDIFISVHHELKKRVGKILCSKSLLAARMDSSKGHPSGDYGRALMVEIWDKIDRWEEPIRRNELPIPEHMVTCRTARDINERYVKSRRRMEFREAYLATQQIKDNRLIGEISVWYKLQAALALHRKSQQSS